MHIDIEETNALFKPFDNLRIRLGYTTFKAAIMNAMMLFIKEHPHDELDQKLKKELNAE